MSPDPLAGELGGSTHPPAATLSIRSISQGRELIAVATLSMLAVSAHAAPPSKDTTTSKSAPIPLDIETYVEMKSGVQVQTVDTLIEVPVGKRAMIQDVSYRMMLTVGQMASCQLYQGSRVKYLRSSERMVDTAFFQANSSTLMFLESAVVGNFNLTCIRNSPSGTGNIQLTLTGWLVDAN